MHESLCVCVCVCVRACACESACVPLSVAADLLPQLLDALVRLLNVLVLLNELKAKATPTPARQRSIC